MGAPDLFRATSSRASQLGAGEGARAAAPAGSIQGERLSFSLDGSCDAKRIYGLLGNPL